jgi:hypothetical protein
VKFLKLKALYESSDSNIPRKHIWVMPVIQNPGAILKIPPLRDCAKGNELATQPQKDGCQTRSHPFYFSIFF